jgi:hypothetical protein
MLESKRYECHGADGQSRCKSATQVCNQVTCDKLFFLSSLACILALFMPLHLLHAQTDLASITGTVTDSAGAALPNSKVEIKNMQTTAVRAVTTDANGFYSAPSLTVGSYAITATVNGFEKTTQSAVLTLGGLTVNFQLRPGSVSQEITVSGASGSVALQTDSHDVSVSIDSQQLVNLPDSGRSILNISTLGPASQTGTDSSTAAGDQSFYGQTSSAVVLAGLGAAQTQFLQDGIDNTNLLTQTANILASVEAVQEVSTVTNNAPSRFHEPAVVNVITKSGSNAFHGTAYDFLQNDAANATNWYATSKAPLRYNLFGGNFGGPVLRNKLFGFFDYSGLRSHTSGLSLDRVPTVEERAGNFSADPEIIYDPSTYNPATGTSSPFANNTLPSISPFAQLWLQNYPQPNVPLNTNNVNYIVNIPSSSNYDEYLGRVDWNMSAKNQLFGTIARLNSSGVNNTITPGLFGITAPLAGTNASLNDTYIVNDHMVNAFKVGYNRSNLLRSQQGTGAKNYAQFYGLQNLNPLLEQSTPPSISISNYTSLGDPYSPQGAIQNRYQFADEFTWKLGNHTLSFGGEYVRVQFNGDWVVGNNGIYAFDGTATSQYINGVRSPSDQGNALADLELGYPVTGNALTGVSAGAFREYDVAGYVQDDWKVTPRLTLNLGIRYDFDNPPNDKNGRGALYVLPTDSNSPGSWIANFNDWGPRVGFSYSATKTTAIRGGYGIYYAPILYNNLQFMLLYSPNVVNQFYSLNIEDPQDIQTLFTPNPPSVPGQGGYTLNRTLKDSSAQEWNLNVEQALGPNMMLTLEYLGNVMRHQSVRADFNQPDALSAGNTSGKLDARPYPWAGPIDGQINFLNANYNAMGVKFERRMSNDLQFLASYTWSKAMDDTDGDNTDVQDFYNPGLTYGRASFDRTNNFALSGIYLLPFGPGKRFAQSNNILNRELVGGWQLTGIQQFATGQPFSIYANNNADTSPLHSVFANVVCDPMNGYPRTRFQIYNSACFTQPGAGQYGTARSIGTQPSTFGTNLALMKNFAITERHQLQFRAEAFNVFNHPLFTSASSSVTSPTLGEATYQLNAPRSMQFALRYSF